MSDDLPPAVLAELSTFVASRMGLHFPLERWADLSKGLRSAAREQGFPDAATHARWLLSTPLTRREIVTLASHLTVGETYFFREKESFRVLEDQVLPELIKSRRALDRRLRIWSAGCCTGEEPYSIAMLLDRLIPDIAEWNITILATDINPRFLEIASLGIFGEWSFRAIPDGIRERYFSPVHGGKMQIVKHIGDMVTFAVLNLAEDSYPSLVNNTNAMDLVLCRNVLMYFTPENAARVIRGFHHVLAVDGWLLAAPSESSPALFREFTMVGFPDVIFFRNSLPAAIAPVEIQEHRAPREELPRANDPPTSPPPVVSPGLAARELANGGRLADAHAVCDHAISLDPLNPLYRFLRALVEQEQGQLDAAVKSLQQSLYLDKDFVMAHFALGNLGKRLGRHALSRRHFRGAMSLLATMEPESPLPESDGLSAGRLAEVIRFATAGEGDHS